MNKISDATPIRWEIRGYPVTPDDLKQISSRLEFDQKIELAQILLRSIKEIHEIETQIWNDTRFGDMDGDEDE